MKKLGVLLLTSLLLFQPVYSATPDLPPNDMVEFYYDLGVGTGIHDAGGNFNSQKLYMVRDFGLILGSGNFNPVFSIKQTLNNIADEVKSKLLGIGTAITSTISALPGYIFCRANPLGCQLHENYTIRAEKKASVAVKYFEDMERELADSRGQLEGWFQAAKSNRLITAIKNAPTYSGNKDLEEIVDKVREFKGKEGLKWIGGTFAGGNSQEPIRPIADTVRAGFNYLLGRAATTRSSATGSDPILDVWDSPEEAAKWVADVVGENRPDIDNKKRLSSGVYSAGSDDGDSGQGGEDVIVTQNFLNSDMSTAAMGLAPKVKKERLAIYTKISDLVNSGTTPTTAQLTQLMGKSTTTTLPKDIFFQLRNSKMQKELIAKLSDDIAVSNVIHYAMLGRRMLLAGRQDPHIGSYDIAIKEIDRKVMAIEKEIEFLIFEKKVNSTLLSSTITKMYNYSNAKYNKAGLSEGYKPTRSFGDGSLK